MVKSNIFLVMSCILIAGIPYAAGAPYLATTTSEIYQYRKKIQDSEPNVRSVVALNLDITFEKQTVDVKISSLKRITLEGDVPSGVRKNSKRIEKVNGILDERGTVEFVGGPERVSISGFKGDFEKRSTDSWKTLRRKLKAVDWQEDDIQLAVTTLMSAIEKLPVFSIPKNSELKIGSLVKGRLRSKKRRDSHGAFKLPGNRFVCHRKRKGVVGFLGTGFLSSEKDHAAWHCEVDLSLAET